MYDLLPYIFSVIFIVLGGCMFFIPQKCLKEADRNSEEAIKKAKRNGVIIMVIAVILMVSNIWLSLAY